MIIMRKAIEQDRQQIAYCIAEAFSKDFSAISNNITTVSCALQSGIQIERFFVAVDLDQSVMGVVAVSDSYGRSVITNPKSYKKHFGFIKGQIASMILKGEFDKPLLYPNTVGYLEFVCVLKRHQRKGVTTKLLEYVITNTDYKDYELDVTNINIGAIKCYEKFGFVEYRREAVKHSKQKGFEEKIYMKYGECSK